jgi:quercetin dioxygenase-like cupin family protein
MKIRVAILTTLTFIAGFALAQQSMQQTQQSTLSKGMQQPVVVNPQGGNLVSSPALPDCYVSALARGDPKGAGSVTLVRLSSGCVIPRHWHSANEEITFTSGTGQLEMEGGQPQTVSAGTYIYMPAKHIHQLTCKDSCSFSRTVDGPLDIHYVDTTGSEINITTALAAVGERPGSAAAQK